MEGDNKLIFKRGTRKVPVVIADTHSGHKKGLINPETPSNDGYKPYMENENQEHLAKLCDKAFKEVVEFAGKDEIILFHLGELCQGKGKAEEIVSTRIADHIHLAKYVMVPWLDLPNVKECRLVPGTDFHEFGESSATLLVTAELQERYKDKKDIKFVYHGVYKANGVAIDYSHQGPSPGTREWVKGNAARSYLRDRMWKDNIGTYDFVVIQAHRWQDLL